MGSLGGHILPGSFFLLFGLWWAWSVFHKYFYSLKEVLTKESLTKRRKESLKYRGTSSFPCAMCYKIPVEGIIKIIACTGGLAAEYVTAYKDGVFTHYGNIQHITMYIFFGLNGALDVLTSTGRVLVPNLDYVTGILAFTMEGILFSFHLDGSKPMEVRVHKLLILLIVGTVLSCIWEMACRRSVLASLSRTYFVLLQGIWFYQIGFILFVYKWMNATSTQMKMVTYIFGWHCAGVFLFLLVAGYVIRWKVFNWTEAQLPYDVLYSIPSYKRTLYATKDINLEELSSSDEL